jgi:two-component system LytT family sensor kinase
VDDGHFTTVKDEFTFLRSYVDIMQHRFGDRVSVKIDCDSDVESMSIPVLILQPLVENAYVHGVGPRSTGGTIEVTGVLEGNCIKLIVSDNGVGEDSVDGNDKGIALDNLRSRLSHLYGGRESLATSSRPGGGFRAVILLPILLDPVEPK